MVNLFIRIPQLDESVIRKLADYIRMLCGRIYLCERDMAKEEVRYQLKGLDLEFYLDERWMTTPWGIFRVEIDEDDLVEKNKLKNIRGKKIHRLFNSKWKCV